MTKENPVPNVLLALFSLIVLAVGFYYGLFSVVIVAGLFTLISASFAAVQVYSNREWEQKRKRHGL